MSVLCLAPQVADFPGQPGSMPGNSGSSHVGLMSPHLEPVQQWQSTSCKSNQSIRRGSFDERTQRSQRGSLRLLFSGGTIQC